MSSVHASPIQSYSSAHPTYSYSSINYATLPTYSSIQYSNLPTYSTVPLPIPWVTGPATYPGTHGHTSCDEGMIHRIILSICIPMLVLWTVLFVLIRRFVIRRRNRNCNCKFATSKALDAEEGQIKLPDTPELGPVDILVNAEEELKEHSSVPAKQLSFLNDREAEEQPLLGKNGSDSD